jgi:hypothetical protein
MLRARPDKEWTPTGFVLFVTSIPAGVALCFYFTNLTKSFWWGVIVGGVLIYIFVKATGFVLYRLFGRDDS